MNPTIPPVLAPHIQQCVDERSLTLLTSVLDTPANWLLVRLLATALHEAKPKPANAATIAGGAASAGCKVLLLSLWRSFDLWLELAKNCAVNLQDEITSGRLCYVDGLSTSSAAATKTLFDLKQLSLRTLSTTIAAALQSLSAPADGSKAIIFIDGLDFLLACEPLTTAIDVQHMLLDLQTSAHSLIITCAADSALMHNSDASATPLEIEHAVLVRSLAHQARWVFQLRPLETGHSKDVGGTVRISKGGGWEEAGDGRSGSTEDNEWLYHIKSDGVVKVWGRGET